MKRRSDGLLLVPLIGGVIKKSDLLEEMKENDFVKNVKWV